MSTVQQHIIACILNGEIYRKEDLQRLTFFSLDSHLNVSNRDIEHEIINLVAQGEIINSLSKPTDKGVDVMYSLRETL